jgi:hypothetical protein
MQSSCAGNAVAVEHRWRRHANVVFYVGERRAVRRASRRVFRHLLRPSQYAGLTGATKDAVVEVGTYGAGLYLEAYPPMRRAYHVVQLVRARRARPVVAIDAFRVHRSVRGSGFGLWLFCRQLRAAVALGVERIEVFAGRGPGQNGYYTWPRFGFAGPLPAAIRRRLPSALRDAEDVLDLMDSEPGRRWWKRHGMPIPLAFDLTARSRSWQVLRRYVCQQPGRASWLAA